jgi:hypothetical protein
MVHSYVLRVVVVSGKGENVREKIDPQPYDAMCVNVPTARFCTIEPIRGDRALEDRDDPANGVSTSNANLIFSLMVKEAYVAAALSFLMLVVLILFAKFLVWVAIFIAVVTCWLVGGAMTLLIYNNDDLPDNFWIPAVVFGVLGILIASWAYCVRHRIAFASGTLSVACAAVIVQPLLFVIAMFILGLQVAWVCVSTLAIIGANDQASSDNGRTVGIFGHVVMFLWGMNVLKYMLHVVVSDSVGDWWDNSNGCGSTLESFRRTCTIRLGSICFGALLMALLGTIKTFFDWLAYESKATDNRCLYVIHRMFAMIAGCLECIMKHFNSYTFSYVGIYGHGYLHSGSEVLHLFTTKGWTAIVNDALVENVLFVAALTIAVVTSLAGVRLRFFRASPPLPVFRLPSFPSFFPPRTFLMNKHARFHLHPKQRRRRVQQDGRQPPHRHIRRLCCWLCSSNHNVWRCLCWHNISSYPLCQEP